MTALVSAYTDEGFVVGADGLRKDFYGAIVTETATKIYPTGQADFLGAYGFAGTTALEYADKSMFDILHCASNVATDLRHTRFTSAKQYVEDFCDDLADRIKTANINIALPETRKAFLTGIFVGYSNGRPFRVQVEFVVSNGALQWPRIFELREAPKDFCIASGSQVVWDEISKTLTEPTTLAEGEAIVNDYLQRCIQNSTDPYCENIGGKVQIATATNSGFSWLIPPDS
jgi:hypothetical protein